MKKLILALTLIAFVTTGCGTATTAIQKIEITTIDCAAITTPAKANEALANAQVVRIAARDLVAALYPSVLDAAAVRTFDEKIDRPFTDTYRSARTFVDSGQMLAFRGICEALKATVDALIPVVKGGGQ